jgi:hypothetical protein
MVVNIKKLNLWLGVLANVSVLAGVIFLAMEVRQNTNMIQTGNLQSSVALGMEAGSWLLDSEFAGVYELALRDPSKLTAVQALQFDEFLGQRMNIWEFMFNTHQGGSITDVDWASWDAYFSAWIRRPGLRQVWEKSKRLDYGGAGDFLTHVDSILSAN